MRRLSAVPVLLALILALALGSGDDDESAPTPAETTAGTGATPEAADVEFEGSVEADAESDVLAAAETGASIQGR